mmetsp:Transcript_31543/g.56632  ORF Transcript_31543/g.56632 Transcript_31543/m.56632 type:complete len:153 (-) Transcript_31543:2070-2528(-)
MYAPVTVPHWRHPRYQLLGLWNLLVVTCVLLAGPRPANLTQSSLGAEFALHTPWPPGPANLANLPVFQSGRWSQLRPEVELQTRKSPLEGALATRSGFGPAGGLQTRKPPSEGALATRYSLGPEGEFQTPKRPPAMLRVEAQAHSSPGVETD